MHSGGDEDDWFVVAEACDFLFAEWLVLDWFEAFSALVGGDQEQVDDSAFIALG